MSLRPSFGVGGGTSTISRRPRRNGQGLRLRRVSLPKAASPLKRFNSDGLGRRSTLLATIDGIVRVEQRFPTYQ